MIIVSQDKEEIINLDNIQRLFIDADYISAVIYAECIEDDILIGSYKTEERAKEILQEIVKSTIETRKSQELNNFFSGAGIIPSNTYYEMPED
jgi:hypothetical protein|nr:MAG TPA: hypothetical protein [Caudoviricetes sp.]